MGADDAKARATVVLTVYHQVKGRDAVPFEVRTARQLGSADQPYQRSGPKLAATEAWQPLDLGWIDACGLLCVRNDGTEFRVIPTEQERSDATARILEIALVPKVPEGPRTMFSDEELSPMPEPFALVRPGFPCLIEPPAGRSLLIRCQRGTTRYSVFAVPS